MTFDETEIMKKAGTVTALVCAMAAVIVSGVYLATGFSGPRFIHYYAMRPGIALGWLLIWGDNSPRQPLVEAAITIIVYSGIGFIVGTLAGFLARLRGLKHKG